MQYLSSIGLVLCFFGTWVLAWSLTSFINRVGSALDEFERSVSALSANNVLGAHHHLGQRVKLSEALVVNRNMTAAGLGLVMLGTLLQFIPYVWD